MMSELELRPTSSWLKSADLRGIPHLPKTFTYAELRAATSDFSSLNKLGEGGYGLVYKVKLFTSLSFLFPNLY